MKLAESTLRKYAKSDLLERNEEEGNAPIYFHSARCPNYCDYACNGPGGFEIAKAIQEGESRKWGPKDGRCCSCGDDPEPPAEETECPKREDKTHCVHWYEGRPEEQG